MQVILSSHSDSVKITTGFLVVFYVLALFRPWTCSEVGHIPLYEKIGCRSHYGAPSSLQHVSLEAVKLRL